MKFFKPLLTFLFLLTLFLSYRAQASKGQWEQGRIYDLQGSLSYQVYRPTKLSQPPSILLALHGCLQTPEDFTQGAGLEKLADETGAILVVPKQPAFSNLYKCWNWFYPHHLQGLGGPHLLAKITRRIKAQYGARQAFVFGISAGAAMTQIMAMCYSDLFKASAAHHALTFGAAKGLWDAQDVFFEGPARTPEQSARLALKCRGFFKKKRNALPSLIIQGTKGEMSQKHGPAVEKQWLVYHDLIDDKTINGSHGLKLTIKNFHPPSLYKYRSRSWKDSQNRSIIQHEIIEGLGHSWSGGDNTYEFNDPHGPSATQMIGDFFKQWGL